MSNKNESGNITNNKKGENAKASGVYTKNARTLRSPVGGNDEDVAAATLRKEQTHCTGIEEAVYRRGKSEQH